MVRKWMKILMSVTALKCFIWVIKMGKSNQLFHNLYLYNIYNLFSTPTVFGIKSVDISLICKNWQIFNTKQWKNLSNTVKKYLYASNFFFKGRYLHYFLILLTTSTFFFFLTTFYVIKLRTEQNDSSLYRAFSLQSKFHILYHWIHTHLSSVPMFPVFSLIVALV